MTPTQLPIAGIDARDPREVRAEAERRRRAMITAALIKAWLESRPERPRFGR